MSNASGKGQADPVAGSGRDLGPIRTCVGCRRRAPQRELVRIGRGDDGTLAVGRRLPGRGVWLCAGSLACFDLAARRQAFTRGFRAFVADEAVTALRTRFVPSPPTARD